MTIVVVLILIALAYAAYHFGLFKKLPITSVSPDKGQDTSHPSAPAQVAPSVAAQAPAQPATGSDNPFLDAYRRSNPQYADTSGGENAPAVDTSGDTLDFAKVGNGVPIKLTGPKKVVNCPAKIRVEVFQVSGDASAKASATATVNGVSQLGGYAVNVFENVAGPEVTVSVDSPGYEFEIRA